MEILYWACNFMLCVLKLRIISFGIIGLEAKGRKSLAVLYPVLFGVVMTLAAYDAVGFDTVLSYLAPYGVALLVVLELKRWRQGIIVMLAIFIATLLDVVSAFAICAVATISLPDLYLSYGLRLMAEAIPMTFLFVVQGVIRRKDRNKTVETLGKEYLLAFAIMVGIHAVLLIAIPNGFFVDPQIYGGQIFYALMFNCVVFLASVALYSINLVKRRQSDAEKLKYVTLYTQQRDYFETLLQKDRETRRLRHDMLTHLYCIENYLLQNDNDAARAYLSSLLKDTNSTQPLYKTGNIVLDAVLNRAVEYPKDVKLAVKGSVPDALNISDADLCVIFSNLLSNAAKAAEKHENKVIDIEFRWMNKHMHCIIGNYTVDTVKLKRGYPVLPSDDGHGYGVPNAMRAVVLNNGSIDFSQDGDYFKAEIVLHNVKA